MIRTKEKKARKTKARHDIMAAIDAGSSGIVCLIARVNKENGEVDILGVAQQASEGIKGGLITDLAAAGAAICKTVHTAENMAASALGGYPLRDAVLAVPTLHVHSLTARGAMHLKAGRIVTAKDILHVRAAAQEAALVSLPAGSCELIHTIPTDYIMDNKRGITQPLGLYGSEFGVETFLITADGGPVHTLAACASHAHLDIVGLCVGAYAAGLSCLVEDEMNLGCTVIDMGGGSTSFAVFSRGGMIYCDSVPVGGDHITTDIARGLTISLAEAGRIKALYGNAMAGNFDDAELIEAPRLGEEGEMRHIPRSLLIGIIQPRAEEIFEMVRAKLVDSNLGSAMGRRVVLTGGTSQMAGMRELAQHVLNRQVRLGRPMRPAGLPQSASTPIFAVAAGLLTYITTHAHEMPAHVMREAQPTNIWDRLQTWVRENW